MRARALVIALGLLLGVGVLGAGPAAALAGTTTIGMQTLTSSSPALELLTTQAPVFQGDTSGGYVLSAPANGTITSWSFLSGQDTQGSMFELRVVAEVTPGDPNTWRVLGSTAPVPVTTATGTDGVNGPYPAKLAISAGDRIALQPITDNNTPIETGVPGQDGILYMTNANVTDGASSPVGGVGADSGQVVPIQATLSYTPNPIANVSLPAVSPTGPHSGDMLTCTPGTWAETPDSTAYQWLRDGVAIGGATNSTYTATEDDLGHALSCQVTVTANTFDQGQATSTPTDPVKPGAAPVPTNRQLPSISDANAARQFDQLTASPGLWQNGVTSFAYQWERCATASGDSCSPIDGATGATYVPVRDDIGSTLRVQVIATNGAGPSTPAVSTPTKVVQRGVVEAHFTETPILTCVGLPETVDASASVSPDGIASYRVAFVNLENFDAANETQARGGVFGLAFAFLGGLFSPFDLSERTFDVKYGQVVRETFGWDRYAIPGPDAPPGIVYARDPVGIELDVTDFAGHTATAYSVVSFAQLYSTDSRASCPRIRPTLQQLASASVLSKLLTISGKGATAGISSTVSCKSNTPCTNLIVITASSLSLCKSCAKAGRARRPIVLANGVFTLKPHRKGSVFARLTHAGRNLPKLLAHGGALRVTMTVTATGTGGKTVTHRYAELLRR